MWPYLQTLVPLCTVALASAICVGVCHSWQDTQNLRHELMVFIPNKSTADHLFEKAEQYFRRSRTDSNGRVRLDARGNVFMARAIELDVKLQNLAKGTFIPSFLARA